MARIRYLKPDFFKDEDLAPSTLVARMTFAGLWCHADREGRLEFRPRYLKAEIWPYDDVDMDAILKHLAAPEVSGRPGKAFICIYEVGGRKYIQILEFLKHQRPHHTERPSIIPPPNGALTVKPPFSDGEYPAGMGMGNGDGKEKGKPSGKPEDVKIPYQEVIEDLNNKTGKAYKHTTKSTRSFIQARWNDGFRLEDFKKVHSNMAAKWLTNQKMQSYLRPDTLYSPKFEGYLNEKSPATGSGSVDSLSTVPEYKRKYA